MARRGITEQPSFATTHRQVIDMASSSTDVRATTLRSSAPDNEWHRLYRVGGVCAVLYVVVAVLATSVMTAAVEDFWDVLVDAPRLLEFISGNTVYWHVLQGLVLESSILLIVTFTALFVALRRADRVWAAIGAVVSVTAQVLFMAYYPVLLGLAYLGGEYATAAPARQAELATAAEALIAQNSGFNPVYEALVGAGVLLLSIAMLKGAFPRWLAFLGIATFAASAIGLSLYPVVGLNYLLWWVVLIVWLVAVGWKLWVLGSRRGT